jgi:hypothetical protein
MSFSIDWEKYVRDIVDLGSESYEQKQMRIVFKVACVALFVIVVWRFLK